MAGLIGRKLGMTQIFDATGRAVPVTVLEAGPCPILRVKTAESDGYSAVQLGFGRTRPQRSLQPEQGHARKAGLDYSPMVLREFRTPRPEAYEVGQALTVSQFEMGEKVKLTGTTKGRGFQGVVKRHGFTGRPASHGHPRSRTPGSIGPGTDPSRVFKGRKMAGQMGNARKTVRNLRVEGLDEKRNLIFVRGSVPGARNSLVLIRKS